MARDSKGSFSSFPREKVLAAARASLDSIPEMVKREEDDYLRFKTVTKIHFSWKWPFLKIEKVPMTRENMYDNSDSFEHFEFEMFEYRHEKKKRISHTLIALCENSEGDEVFISGHDFNYIRNQYVGL